MAMAFAQSMRALAADRGRWALASLIMVMVLVGGWGAWFVLARVAIYEVTRTARLEVDQAVHPIATPVAGRVVATHLVVGRDVQAGEVLVELDAAAFRLQHEEAREWSTALTTQRQARRRKLVAEAAAQQDERQAAGTALAEARARQHEAEVALQAAAAQADVFARLQARGLAPQLDLLRTRAEADLKRAAADTLRLAVSRLEREQRTKDSDRTARLTQFHRELTRLDGDIRTAEATLARLDHSIEQTRIRAPIAGRLGEVANVQQGAVVRQGDTLGVVLPVGALRVVAHFLPAVALGRVQPGQAGTAAPGGVPLGTVRQPSRHREQCRQRSPRWHDPRGILPGAGDPDSDSAATRSAGDGGSRGRTGQPGDLDTAWGGPTSRRVSPSSVTAQSREGVP